MKKKSIIDLLISVLAAELTGALSGLIVGNSFIYYRELKLPPLSPPGFVFPIVWAILYALMGISAYLICLSDSAEKRKSLILYALQLFVNFMWSIIFFRFKALSLSAVISALLFALILVMMLNFRKINNKAAYLNIPYLIWSLFAVYLSVGAALLNFT